MYKHLLRQTIDIKKTKGTDEYGVPIESDIKKNILCRIDFKNKLIISSGGEQITSVGSLITYEPVVTGDIISIKGREYKVIQVSPMIDFDGVTVLYKVNF